MNDHDLFSHGRCDRCHQPMTTRVTSFFMEEVICMDCSHREGALISRLHRLGADLSALGGCGYLPQLEKEISRPHGKNPGAIPGAIPDSRSGLTR